MASKRLAKRAPARKRRPRIIRKAIDAADRVLDQIIADPDAFLRRAERVAEHTARGVDRFLEEYEKNPEKAKKETRDFVIRNIARFGKKKLRAAR